jgi:competence protein ComEC
MIQFVSISAQKNIYFPQDIIGTQTDNQIVQISSSPNVSDSFGKTRCTYQALGYQPKMYMSLVTLDDQNCELKYGAQYNVSGTYKEDDFHLKNAASLQVKTVENYKDANWLDSVCNNIHANFLVVAKELPGDSPGLVPGMSIGDTRYLAKSTNDATKVAGLTHLTAISGSHFVIIISIIGSLLMLIKVNKKIQALLQISSVLLLTILVHPSDSVKRAAIMSVIGLSSIFLKRRAVSISALAFVVCTWMILDPSLSCSYGFALSACATASIILFSGPLQIWLSRFVGRGFASILSVPIVAQLGCTPILLMMTDYLTIYGPLANIAVIPFVEPGTILSLIACLIAPLSPTLSYYIALIAGFFTQFVAEVAKFTANLPGAKIPWISGPVGGAVILIIVCLLVLSPRIYRVLYGKITGLATREETSRVILYMKWRDNLMAKSAKNIKKGMTHMIKKQKRLLLSCLVTATIVGVLIVMSVRNVSPPISAIPENWLIAACPVGQGDGAAIRTGKHSAIVIDTGPSTRDTGGESIVDCLHDLDVETVDELQLSHYHDDHIGGVKELLANFKVNSALLPPIKQPQSGYEGVINALDKKGVNYQYAKQGQQGEFGCSEIPEVDAGEKQSGNEEFCARYQVLSIWDDAGENGVIKDEGAAIQSKTTSSAEDDRENDSSVNMLFVINGVEYWTAGDLETKGDKGAAKAFKELLDPITGKTPPNIVSPDQVRNGVDVVKVNHHGSKTQSTELNKLLKPSVAIYMAGKNSYGHPNSVTIEAFETLGARTLRTDTYKIEGVLLNDQGELATFPSS